MHRSGWVCVGSLGTVTHGIFVEREQALIGMLMCIEMHVHSILVEQIFQTVFTGHIVDANTDLTNQE